MHAAFKGVPAPWRFGGIGSILVHGEVRGVVYVAKRGVVCVTA